jgi:glycosyltransferase involved in cell wall biosynthesis
MVPLYLPLTLDEEDQSRGMPVFFGGLNVYLDQQFGWFRRWSPGWLREWLSSPGMLRWASGRAAKTRASDVGDLTLSMLRGEEGNQARDLEELAGWLAGEPRPDVVCLSNAMLLGMARELRLKLGAPVVCMLQGEDAFLDALPTGVRSEAWRILRERAKGVDGFMAPSRFFADLMAERLGVERGRIRVVANGIALDGYPPVGEGGGGGAGVPVVGYFARMCLDKGLDLVVDAFIELARRSEIPGVRLHVGGGCGPADEPLVVELQQKLERAGLADRVKWVKNPDRAGKLEFLRSCSVLSVPARCGEAFGLYVVEAWASGVPVVLPRAGAFSELVESTGGGLLCESTHAVVLAGGLASVLGDESKRREMGLAGQRAVYQEYGVDAMARRVLGVFEELAQRPGAKAVVNAGSVG